MAWPQYQYTPLKEDTRQFRILELNASNDKNVPISCSLQAVDIEQRPSYEALSYTWGVEAPRSRIKVNDCNFKVRPNLESALRHLRLPTQARLLWIDAICINQDDIHEKGSQLPLMQRIYSNAATVLIWLGEFEQDVEDTFEYLQSIPKNQWGYYEWPDVDDSEFRAVLPGLEKLSLDKFDGLIGRLTGWKADRTIKFEALMDRIDNIWFIRNTFLNVVHLRTRQDTNDILTLERLMIATSDRSAGGAKDQVFAVLGMLPNYELSPIAKMYGDSVSQIYQAVMLAMIQQRKDLHLLSYAALPRQTNKYNLPSWCPDFSIQGWAEGHYQRNVLLLPHKRLQDNRSMTLDTSRSFDIRHDATKGSLTVFGTELGSVHGIEHFNPHGAAFVSHLEMQSTASGDSSTKNKECATQRAHDCLKLILNDWDIFWFALLLIPEVCLNDAKARELLELAVSSPVFTPPASNEIPSQCVQRQKEECSDKRLPHYFLQCMLWGYHYVKRECSSITDGDNDYDNNPDLLHETLDKDLDIQVFTVGEYGLAASFYGVEKGLTQYVDGSMKNDDIVCRLQRCNNPAVLRPKADGRYQLITFINVPGTYTNAGLENDSLGNDFKQFELC